MKYKNNTLKEANEMKKLQKKDLKNLDEFIQKCLDNFKFMEVKRELYEATGSDKDVIISHKSTIPDLVIWNKTFNKNKCFIGANTSIPNEFPRFLFFIKIKKNKRTKNSYNNNHNCNSNINNFNNHIYSKDKREANNKIDNAYTEFDFEYFRKDNNEKENDININNNSFNTNKINKKNINKNNIYEYNNKSNQKKEKKNKFSFHNNIHNNTISNININKVNIDNNYNNTSITIFLIQLYLNKNGWIILINNNNFSGPGTSINLFQFLQEKIKENINLNDYIIIDINKQVKYLGNYFYMLLSNILPIILQKKQIEFKKFEEIMNKQFHNQNTIMGDINNNSQNHYYNNFNQNIISNIFSYSNNNSFNSNKSNNLSNINYYNLNISQQYIGKNSIENINNNDNNSVNLNKSNSNFINEINNCNINSYNNFFSKNNYNSKDFLNNKINNNTFKDKNDIKSLEKNINDINIQNKDNSKISNNKNIDF